MKTPNNSPKEFNIVGMRGAYTLTHTTSIRNRVACPQSVLCNSQASTRKSDIEQYVTDLLLRSNGAPESWVKGGILLTDATKVGAEANLSNHQEGLASSSEAANTVFIPGIRSQESGIRFLSRRRLCQWTQAEGVCTSTGAGQTTLEPMKYKCLIRLLLVWRKTRWARL